MTTGVLQVGFGNAGRKRARCLVEMADVELVGIVETDVDARSEATELLTPARIFDCLDHALDRRKPDAVVVSTPPDLHVELTPRFLAQGIDVLCEKPLGRNAAEMQLCIEVAQGHGRVLKVATNHLFMPSVVAALDHLANGLIGNLRSIRATVGHDRAEALDGWHQDIARSGGGALRDNGSHALFVASQALRQVSDDFGEALECVLRGPRGSVDWDARAVFRSRAGTDIKVHASWMQSARYVFDMVFEGDRGCLRICGPEHLEYAPKGAESSVLECDGGDGLSSWMADTREFIEAVRGRASPALSWSEALQCMTMVDALYVCSR